MPEKILTEDTIQREIFCRLKQVEKLNYLELYALFMGKAQIIEFILKRLLIEKYNYSFEDVERYTLGKSINELKNNDLRKDFITLLEKLNKYRVEMAHNFLYDNIITMQILNLHKSPHLTTKILNHELYCVEEVIIVYGFLSANDLL